MYTVEPLFLNQDSLKRGHLDNRTAFAELTSGAVEVDTERSLSSAKILKRAHVNANKLLLAAAIKKTFS